MNEVISVNDLGISFGSNHVLKSVNFHVGPSEVLGVIGPNGAGKTVMLNILTGLLKPSHGTIEFMGEDIIGKSINDRCKMGFGRTFQVPKSFEKMTVFENVIVGGVYGNNLHEKEAKVEALRILEFIGMKEKADKFAGSLGLLDRKRLEIGRALASDPKVLMFDEVAGGLTESEVSDILAIVRKIKENGVSVIWIEHVLQTMLEGTDRVLCLAEGRDIICGDPHEVMKSDEVARCYLGCDDDEDAEQTDE